MSYANTATASCIVREHAVQLEPGDVLLFPVSGWGILYPMVRALIKYDHAAIYYTETKRGLPLIIESVGRGVLIRSLYCYTGRQVLVRRHVDSPTNPLIGVLAARTAEHLADNPKSFYDYFAIPRFVLPKLLYNKLGRILPARISSLLWFMEHTYHRNNLFICSELVTQAYNDAGYPIVEEGTIPLPDDLAASDRLVTVGEFTVGGNN
jgi:hypothetical protein